MKVLEINMGNQTLSICQYKKVFFGLDIPIFPLYFAEQFH